MPISACSSRPRTKTRRSGGFGGLRAGTGISAQAARARSWIVMLFLEACRAGGQRAPLLMRGQMLAAVQGDHLARHGRSVKQETHGCGNLFRMGAAFERGAVPLPRELLRRLPRARQDRTGADAVDPDARRERHGKGL